MSRLTLRLPETLHQQLETLAQSEEVSLDRYILYALTRQVASAYVVESSSDRAIFQQEASYAALLQSLGHASFGEVERVMAEREKVGPGKGLTPDVIQVIAGRISEQRT